MIYLESQPCEQLRPFIRTYWIVEDVSLEKESPKERIVPDGSIELIVHYGDPPTEYCGGDKGKTQDWVLLAGQQKSAMIIRPGQQSGMIGVRFHPAGASRFFDPPMSEFSGAVHSLDAISKGTSVLAEQVFEAPCFDSKFLVLEKFLVSKMADARSDLIVSEAAKHIAANNGIVDIKELIKGFGISERQVERKFKYSVGIGAKSLARIFRLQHLIQMKEATPSLSLTDLAMECEYFDQSHFIRDFKKLTGLTPKAYFREHHEIADFFNNSP